MQSGYFFPQKPKLILCTNEKSFSITVLRAFGSCTIRNIKLHLLIIVLYIILISKARNLAALSYSHTDDAWHIY